MNRVIDMRKKRAGLIHDARALLDNAEEEKRSLTAEEREQYDRIDGEIDRLEIEADRLERQIQRERALGEPGAPIIGGSGPIGDLASRTRMALDDRGREIPLLTHEQRMADYVQDGILPEGMRADEVTTGRIVRGMLTGWAGLEREHRALQGSEDPQGGYLLPGPLSARFLDQARARMVLSQAGAVTVPVDADSLKIPKLLADPTPYWRGELEEITESDPTFGAVVLKPRTVAILTLVSHEVWEDAAGLGAAVEGAMSQALALEIDRAGLLGGGSGNESEPKGIYYTDGVNTVEMDTDGAVPAGYGKFLDAIEKIEDANGNPSTIIFNPRTKRTLAGLVTGIADDKTPLTPPADFTALRRLITTSIPSDLTWGSDDASSAAFVGGFENVYMGMRQRVRIDVSPHGSGVFNRLGLWVRAFARVDFAIVRPAQLVRITGIKKGAS